MKQTCILDTYLGSIKVQVEQNDGFGSWIFLVMHTPKLPPPTYFLLLVFFLLFSNKISRCFENCPFFVWVVDVSSIMESVGVCIRYSRNNVATNPILP